MKLHRIWCRLLYWVMNRLYSFRKVAAVVEGWATRIDKYLWAVAIDQDFRIKRER